MAVAKLFTFHANIIKIKFKFLADIPDSLDVYIVADEEGVQYAMKLHR